jgi:wobble nucleotide-excising tRNase
MMHGQPYSPKKGTITVGHALRSPHAAVPALTMMNNSYNVLKQPFVRTIVDEQDVASVGRKPLPEVAPSLRDYRANVARPYSLDDSGCHFCRSLDADAAKAKIDRSFADFDESIDGCKQLINRWFAETETANVYMEAVG